MALKVPKTSKKKKVKNPRLKRLLETMKINWQIVREKLNPKLKEKRRNVLNVIKLDMIKEFVKNFNFRKEETQKLIKTLLS